MRRWLRGLWFFLRTGHKDPLSIMDAAYRKDLLEHPMTEEQIREAIKDLYV